jgi:hypothetical protein
VGVEKMNAAKDKANAAVPLAEAISRVGKALQELMVDKKGEKESILALIGPGISQIVKDTENIQIDASKIKMLSDLGKALQNFSGLGEGLKTLASSLKDVGASFIAFGSGFGNFAPQIEKFAKFEKSFSALAANQYNYKFDKFAASMGTLKSNVNAFNVENLKLTDSLMKSLAILSKSPDSTGEKIKESIDEAMKQLVDAIKQISDNTETQTSMFGGLTNLFSAPQAPTAPAPGSGVLAPKPGGDQNAPSNAQLAEAINKLGAKLDTLNGKFVIEKGGIKVTIPQ